MDTNDAPVVTDNAAAETVTEAQPNMGELRMNLRQSITYPEAQPEHHSANQDRLEDGKFAPPQDAEGEPLQDEPESGQADAEGASEAGTTEEPQEESQDQAASQDAEGESQGRSFSEVVPPEWEMVKLPEGHPLRDRGIEEWPMVPGFENETKNILSTPIRRRDLEARQHPDPEAVGGNQGRGGFLGGENGNVPQES